MVYTSGQIFSSTAKLALGPVHVPSQGAPLPPHPNSSLPMREPPWVVRKVVPILDLQGKPISPQLEKLQTILEAYYRDKPHAWPSTRKLAELYGCQRRNMQLLLDKGEDARLFHRVIQGRGRNGRVGFLALKRFDPDRPVIADTPEAIAQGIADLKARRHRKAQSAAPLSPTMPPGKAQSTAPIPPGKAQSTAPEERLPSKEDEPVNVRENDNVTSSGGEETRTPEPTVPLQPEPPETIEAAIEVPTPVVQSPAATPTEAKVAEALGNVRSRHPWLRNPALWQLEDWGLLPAELVGQVPPRLPADRASAEAEAEPPSRPGYFVPAAQPSPARSTIEDLIRRLAGSAEEGPARAREIASRLAEKWDDRGSLHGFLPKLVRAARGEIPIKAVLKAYRKAENCGPDAVAGAIFHHTLNATIGGPP
jgi:hypothetical protein